jgi:phospholipase C
MIEWRWNLRPLTVRDASANNLAEVLDFSQRNLVVPHFAVPPGPFGVPCALANVGDEIDFGAAALQLAASLGFPISP